ncbi:MAG: methyltransferase, partial [Treponema sp.]|uniref:methyltransferase n=1 Tax=Treponema sp. TaxID=166 RepID=UPI0025F6AD73
DIIITLHACDTATDYALDYAIRQKAKAILSVPCCQHEINSQLSSKSVPTDSQFASLLKYGLIKERFSALATDAIRAEVLESKGYKVQILEFIEESATPKNLLIRAVRNKAENPSFKSSLLDTLQVHQTLADLGKC